LIHVKKLSVGMWTVGRAADSASRYATVVLPAPGGPAMRRSVGIPPFYAAQKKHPDLLFCAKSAGVYGPNELGLAGGLQAGRDAADRCEHDPRSASPVPARRRRSASICVCESTSTCGLRRSTEATR